MCGVQDRPCALEIVEVRCGEARARCIELDVGRLQGETERDRVEGRLRPQVLVK